MQKTIFVLLTAMVRTLPMRLKKLMNFWMNINKQEKQFALVCGIELKDKIQ